MNILLTGPSGFAGKYLCKILTQNYKVIGLDRINNALVDLIEYRKNFTPIEAELSDKISINEDIDVVVHTAARSPRGTDVSLDEYISGNILATSNIIDFAIRKEVKLMIYFSTISIYGNVNMPVVDENTPIDSPNMYGITKYIGEVMLKEKKYLLNSIILRMPLIIGGKGIETGWFYDLCRTLKAGKPVSLYNGDSPYNFVDLSDICELVSNCIETRPKGTNVFTLTSRDLLTVREIAEMVKHHTNSQSVITERKTDSPGFSISFQKAEKMLGYNPGKAKDIISNYLKDNDLS